MSITTPTKDAGVVFEAYAMVSTSPTVPTFISATAAGTGAIELRNGRYRLSIRASTREAAAECVTAFAVTVTSDVSFASTAAIVPFATAANGCTIPGVGDVFFNSTHPFLFRSDGVYSPVIRCVLCYFGNPNMSQGLERVDQTAEFSVNGPTGTELMYFPTFLASKVSNGTYHPKFVYTIERLW